MQTTRADILEYIANHQTGTATEISHALQMTSANVRHHLHKLTQESLIEIAGTSPQNGRGRPTHIYRLTPKANQDHVFNLFRIMWDEFIGDRHSKQRTSRLIRIARRLIGVVDTVDGGLTQRLYQTVQLLGEMDYEARWEAHAEGPQLLLIKCPLASLLPTHMDVCLLDTAVLQELLGFPVHQISQRDHHHGGQSFCVFRVLSGSDHADS